MSWHSKDSGVIYTCRMCANANRIEEFKSLADYIAHAHIRHGIDVTDDECLQVIAKEGE